MLPRLSCASDCCILSLMQHDCTSIRCVQQRRHSPPSCIIRGPLLFISLGLGCCLFFCTQRFQFRPQPLKTFLLKSTPLDVCLYCTGCMFILMTPLPSSYYQCAYISYLKMLHHIQIGLYSALQHILLKY